MAKQECDPFAYLAQFNKLLVKPGALLVGQGLNDQANPMTIGWAHIGVLWSKPVCVVYVRPSRHTYTCLEQLRQFTVNAAGPELARAVALCGSVSGRDQDKFKEANLTPVAAKKVKPPVIQQCLLHYECNVLHYNDLLAGNLHRSIINECYPEGDFHRCYFGEIVACYGDPEALAKV